MAHVINGIFYFTYHVQHTCGIFVPGVGPSWAVYPCTSAEFPSYHAVSCNMQTGSFVSPLHFHLTKMLRSTYICSVLKDGRAFLGTLALDSNCIVWFTFLVYVLCVHSNSTSTLWTTALSHSFFFFLSLFPVLALYGYILYDYARWSRQHTCSA